jgi:hypothetical protein
MERKSEEAKMLDKSLTAFGTKKTLRCAIYTRKSHEEGLDQEFNSLDAQRELAEAYIESQKLQGWQVLPDRYDDGGYSGGAMERPGLQRLLADIDAGKIDVIVVYKTKVSSDAGIVVAPRGRPAPPRKIANTLITSAKKTQSKRSAEQGRNAHHGQQPCGGSIQTTDSCCIAMQGLSMFEYFRARCLRGVPERGGLLGGVVSRGA